MTMLIDGRGDAGSADRGHRSSSLRERPEDYEEIVLRTTITHRFLRTGNSVHHFLLAGDAAAPAVVLLGGRPDSWWTWHARIEALAAGHFVVAPAQLDHSLRAAHVAAVLADLGVDHIHVVAEPEGAALAAAVAGAMGRPRRQHRVPRHGSARPPPGPRPREPCHHRVARAARADARGSREEAWS